MHVAPDTGKIQVSLFNDLIGMRPGTSWSDGKLPENEYLSLKMNLTLLQTSQARDSVLGSVLDEQDRDIQMLYVSPIKQRWPRLQGPMGLLGNPLTSKEVSA